MKLTKEFHDDLNSLFNRSEKLLHAITIMCYEDISYTNVLPSGSEEETLKNFNLRLNFDHLLSDFCNEVVANTSNPCIDSIDYLASLYDKLKSESRVLFEIHNSFFTNGKSIDENPIERLKFLVVDAHLATANKALFPVIEAINIELKKHGNSEKIKRLINIDGKKDFTTISELQEKIFTESKSPAINYLRYLAEYFNSGVSEITISKYWRKEPEIDYVLKQTDYARKLFESSELIDSADFSYKNIATTPAKTTSTPHLEFIEEKLNPFKDNMSGEDFQWLLASLNSYFVNETVLRATNMIKITGKINIKAFGWAFNEIYRKHNSKILSMEYVEFLHDNIDRFNKLIFKKDDRRCQMYLYLTQNVNKIA